VDSAAWTGGEAGFRKEDLVVRRARALVPMTFAGAFAVLSPLAALAHLAEGRWTDALTASGLAALTIPLFLLLRRGRADLLRQIEALDPRPPSP
jgi:hypothetical protein